MRAVRMSRCGARVRAAETKTGVPAASVSCIASRECVKNF